MDDVSRHVAIEWFDRADRDLETAEFLHRENWHGDTIAYHTQQAIEKHLKGYLAFRGQNPPRIHDLGTLLNLVSRLEPDLYSPYIDLCEKATRYYLAERYPPGPSAEYDRAELGADLALVHALAKAIRDRARI
jgi:HEPN domain-containing protein